MAKNQRPAQATHSADDLLAFVDSAGESRNIDAKGPMEWDGKEQSASLTKDILAMANSRDGGVLVIGKSETTPGKFDFVGVSPNQAATFETTKVATWVNNQCAPPVDLVCYTHERQGKLFVVIAVPEFKDVPVLCTKQFDVQAKSPKLRKGAIYVRTANAESAPVSTIEEWRSLIGLATMKRGDDLLKTFQAIMKGQPLLGGVTDEERWNQQSATIRSELEAELGSHAKNGRWTFTFHPSQFVAERWADAATLKNLVEKYAVRTIDEFPPVQHGLHVRNWGIANHEFKDVFGLARSGLFVSLRIFREDQETYRDPWQPNPNIEPGHWMEFQWNMAQIIEFFVFMERFAHELDPSDELSYSISASPLSGRKLVTLNPDLHFFSRMDSPCGASFFDVTKSISAGTLIAAWEDECIGMLLRFFELFRPNLTSDAFRKWLERFKARRFWR